MVTRRDMIGLAAAGLAGTALESSGAITRSALALRGAMMGGGKMPFDTTGMTLLTIESNSTYMDFGIYSAALATGSTGVTIYWDVESDPSDKTEYVGDLLEPSHTYSTEGRHVIAISDDIKNIYMVSGSSKTNPYAMRIASVLVGFRGGDKLTSLPTITSGTSPDGIYGVARIVDYDLNNIGSQVRPCFGCGVFGGNYVLENVICNKVTQITTYAFESCYELSDIFCNSLTYLNPVSRVGFYRHTNLHFDSPCAIIAGRSDIFNINTSNISYLCSDGHIEWDGTSWVPSLYNSPSVTDYVGYGSGELLNMFDGIRNVGAESPHDSSSVIWKDLVGQLDCSVNNHGTWGDNCLNTDGNAQAASASAQLSTSTRFVEVVLKCETNGNAVTVRTPTSGNRYFYATDTGYAPADVRIKGLDTNPREYHYVAFGYSGDNRIIAARYVDGVSVGESATSVIDKNAATVFAIGGRYTTNNTDACKCSVCAVRVYSRVLTAVEVAYNYAVDKARFNI